MSAAGCSSRPPNRWFPLEVHTRLPLVHWLPDRVSHRAYDLAGKSWARENHLLGAARSSRALPRRRCGSSTSACRSWRSREPRRRARRARRARRRAGAAQPRDGRALGRSVSAGRRSTSSAAWKDVLLAGALAVAVVGRRGRSPLALGRPAGARLRGVVLLYWLIPQTGSTASATARGSSSPPGTT